MHPLRKILFFILLMVLLSACAAVKPYQQVYINDPAMQMGGWAGTSFEDYVHAIRTGSTVAGSKKSTGGCGCN